MRDAGRAQWVPVGELWPDHWRMVWVVRRGSVRLAHCCRIRCSFFGVDTGDYMDGISHWSEIEYPEPPEVQ